MSHYHYLCQGFAVMEHDGALRDACNVDVVASDELEALARAALLVPSKARWRVASVVEHTPELEHAPMNGGA